jgi:hypothetical protein
LGSRDVGGVATDRDCDASSELADALLHRLPGGLHAEDILLATQGFSVGPSEPCPALGSDMRCTVHEDRKPATCSVVPLEALVPDRLQHVVLAERRGEATYLGADCIVPGSRPDFVRLTHRLAVVDENAKESLVRRRRDLADEKRWWGESVFRMLQRDLFANAAALARVPESGSLVMAIAPVLMVLAAVSSRCRERCLAYIDAQIVLIEETLRLALANERLADRRETEQLRAFLRTHRTLGTVLGGPPRRVDSRGPRETREIEMSLGLASSSPPSPTVSTDSR